MIRRIWKERLGKSNQEGRSNLPIRKGKSDLPIYAGRNKELAGANLGAVLCMAQSMERGNG
jgi:hypothetical protein